MYILFFSILLSIIGIVFLIIGITKQKQNLITLQKIKQKEIEDAIKETLAQKAIVAKEYEQLKEKRDAAARDRKIESERLEELKASSRQVLLTEHERLESEINLTRQLKMKQLNQDYENRRDILEQSFQRRQGEIEKQIEDYTNQLFQFKQMQEAANEATRRQKELVEKEAFYSIDISRNDQEDIELLQSMDTRLHNRDVVPKLIWELFVRRPTQEMIKRVVGTEKASGIYKITYKKTGEAYIGKTTDFSTRWQNHVKTAIGLEAAAKSTLHTRMAKDGIWNYTFEVLERVDKELLSSREAYYIELYGTKGQLNMKSGDKS